MQLGFAQNDTQAAVVDLFYPHVVCRVGRRTGGADCVAVCVSLSSDVCLLSQGVTPALRTFNTLIIACNMCNKPREALAGNTYCVLVVGQQQDVAAVDRQHRSCNTGRDVCWIKQQRNPDAERCLSCTFCCRLVCVCAPCCVAAVTPTVYQELRDSGFEANSTTYNALISAYGKLGQLDRVLEVYKDMVWRGLDRR